MEDSANSLNFRSTHPTYLNMASQISSLSCSERKNLFESLFYLNTKELRSFCDKHSIPYRILIETSEGKLKATRDKDRKAIVIKRVRHFLETSKVLPETVFRSEIVKMSGLPEEIDEGDRLYYGCYDKKNPKMISLLRELTGGKFRNGAIARILLRKIWTSGKAPSFKEFAAAWLKAKTDYSLGQHPEAAYLTDRAKGAAGDNWKKKRIQKARNAIEVLDKIPS